MIWVLVAGLLGCAQEETDPPECVHDPVLTYTNFGEGFIDQYCTGCHDSHLPTLELRNEAPLGVNFDTYEMVLLWKDRIRARAQWGIESPMPPGGGAHEADLASLQEWLACDAQDDWDEVYGGGQ